MIRYISHAFGSRDALLRAVRWLMILGFDPGEIEVNSEGDHRLSVLTSSRQSASTAGRVFEAAEFADPAGWPSFWDLSRTPFRSRAPGAGPQPEHPTPSSAAHSAPIGWHPPDERI